jgi:hypothetical protein
VKRELHGPRTYKTSVELPRRQPISEVVHIETTPIQMATCAQQRSCFSSPNPSSDLPSSCPITFRISELRRGARSDIFVSGRGSEGGHGAQRSTHTHTLACNLHTRQLAETMGSKICARRPPPFGAAAVRLLLLIHVALSSTGLPISASTSTAVFQTQP